MHEIQNQILKQLTISNRARYSSIKPPKIGGNQFAYHLKELIKNGMIEKNDIFYSLTIKGEKFADGISLKTFTKRIQPKIVTMLLIKNNKNETLFCKRNKQPFIEKISLPYGKIHMGERTKEAAIREINEKTNLVIENLDHKGDVYLAIYKESDLISHMLCHLFERKITEYKNLKIKENCEWIKEDEINFKKRIPGTKDIMSILKNNKERFFKEIFVEI